MTHNLDSLLASVIDASEDFSFSSGPGSDMDEISLSMEEYSPDPVQAVPEAETKAKDHPVQYKPYGESGFNLCRNNMSPYDVFVGRGKNIYTKNPGNKFFLGLIKAYVEEYRTANSTHQKSQLSKLIVGEVYERGGQFLGIKRDTMSIFELTRKDAVKKTSQAFRDQIRLKEKKSKTSANWSVDVPLRGLIYLVV